MLPLGPAFVLTALLGAMPAGADGGAAADTVEGFWKRPTPAQGPAPAHPPGAEVLADLSPVACGTCHTAQYEAWRDSLHAAAVSPGLLGQLGAFDGATQDDCLSCHAPREEQSDLWRERGSAGSADLAGVDCAACHLRNQVRYGPRALAETPHGPVRASPLHRQAEFCAPCHQFDDSGLAVNGKPLENTYAEWLQSRQGREGVTCQDCHMPAGAHGFKGIHDPETTRQALTVRAWRVAAGLRVLAGNAGAGHALPTYVTPRILIRMEGEDGEPARTHVIARTMRWTPDLGWEELADDRLAPDQWIVLELDLPPGMGGRVAVRVEPDHDYHARVYPALLEMLAEDLSAAELGQLERAREQSGQTGYALYRFRCPPWGGEGESCEEN